MLQTLPLQSSSTVTLRWNCFLYHLSAAIPIPKYQFTLLCAFAFYDLQSFPWMCFAPQSFNRFENSYCQNTWRNKLWLSLNWLKPRKLLCKSQTSILSEYFAYITFDDKDWFHLEIKVEHDRQNRKKSKKATGMWWFPANRTHINLKKKSKDKTKNHNKRFALRRLWFALRRL